jgi:hypothetical protein
MTHLQTQSGQAADPGRSTSVPRIARLLALFAVLELSAARAPAGVILTFTTDSPSPDSMSGTITATPFLPGLIFDRDVTATDLTITGPDFPTPLHLTLPLGISAPFAFEGLTGAVTSGNFLTIQDGTFIDVTVLTSGVDGTTVSMSPAGGAIILGHFTESTAATVPEPSSVVMAVVAIPPVLGYWWLRRRRAAA